MSGLALAASTLVVIPAHAQADLFSSSRFTVLTDVRVVASDAEPSWLEGGYGKTRFGDGDTNVRPVFAEAVLAWTPRFSEHITGVVSVEVQDSQDQFLDIGEAYLNWRAAPDNAVRLSGRAGLYFPLVSLEHDGPDWSVNDTLTPSAINSWIAEELKVVGAEATARFDVLGGEAAATAGLFGYGDKAGTLLAFRGWALHDLKATHGMVFPLPPVGDGGRPRTEPDSTVIFEVDDKVGLYGRLEWQPTPSVMFSLFGYDNFGDRVSRVRTEGAWDTRFLAAGASWSVDETTRAKAQLMTGETAVGRNAPGAFRALVEFHSAFGSLSRTVGPGGLTGRIDYFEVRDLVSRAQDNNDEQGWAATLAYRWDFRPGSDVTVEALTIDSDRPSRRRLGETPEQTDIQLQVAFRNRF